MAKLSDMNRFARLLFVLLLWPSSVAAQTDAAPIIPVDKDVEIEPSAKAELIFRDALSRMIERHGPLVRGRIDTALQDTTLDLINSDKRPSFRVSGTSGVAEQFVTSGSVLSNRSLDSSVGFYVSQLLFDGGNTKARRRRQEAISEASTRNLQAQIRATVDHAAQRYFTVSGLRERLKIRESGISILERQQRSAELRFKIGEGTRTEIGFAKSRLATSRRELLIDQLALDAALESFRQDFGMAAPDLDLAAPNCPGLPQNYEAFSRNAVTRNPALLAKISTEEAARRDLDVARTTLGPRISVEGGAVARVSDLGGFFERQESVGMEARLNFNLPLTSGGQGTALRKRARLALLQATSERVDAHRQLNADARMIWSNYEIYQAALREAEISVSSAQLALRGASRERDAGLRSDLDVLDAENALLTTRLSQVDLKAQLAIAAVRLISANQSFACLSLDVGQILEPFTVDAFQQSPAVFTLEK